MAKLTPQQIADKQVRKATQAVNDYVDGVNSVTESPTAKAAQKVDKYRSGIQDAIDSGRYQEGCMSVGVNTWKEATTRKGRERYAKGVEGSRDKIVDFQTQIAPVREAIQREVASMPDNGIEDSIRRMEHNVRSMANFKYKKKRGS